MIAPSGLAVKPLDVGGGARGRAMARGVAGDRAVWRTSWRRVVGRKNKMTTVCAAYQRRADGPPNESPRARQYSRFASAREGTATTWCWLADTGERALVAR
jgi:hypothetical protein